MTPTHSGIGLGLILRSASRHSSWKGLGVVFAAALVAVLLIAPRSSTGCLTVGQATRGPDLRVTALPGVDLRPVLGTAGLTAASGPYPGVATSLRRGGLEVGTWVEGRPRRTAAVDRPLLVSGSWPARGEIAVDRGLARRLGYRAGERARVTTVSGEVSMRIAGITTTSAVARSAGVSGLAFVLPGDLRTVAPAAAQGSTLLVQVGGDAPAAAQRVKHLFPGPQAVVETAFERGCVST